MTKSEIKEKIVEIFKNHKSCVVKQGIEIIKFKDNFIIKISTAETLLNYYIMSDLSELLQTKDIDVDTESYDYDSCSRYYQTVVIKTKLIIKDCNDSLYMGHF